MARLEVRLDINKEEFRRDLLLEVARLFSSKNVAGLADGLRGEVYRAVENAPEAVAMVAGLLRGELGLRSAAAAVSAVAEEVARRVEVRPGRFVPSVEGLSGGPQLVLLREQTLTALMNLPEAAFTSEGGHEIPWLRWLLTAGDDTIIAEYHFEAGAFGRSRTGLGLMQRGGSWAIAGEFAGTAQDNWITRAVATVVPFVERAFREEFS